MRIIYSLILYLLTPFALLRLLWRGLRAHGYWQRWGERFGFAPVNQGAAPIWVHAVSVGEVQAAVPLLRVLLKRYPTVPVLVTTTTPTGSEQLRSVFEGRVQHAYMPYDLPDAVARFLNRTRPRLALIMETEIWPNLYHACARRGIPVLLVNARLSARSAAGYGRLRRLTAATLECLQGVAAQGRADADRLIGLGAPPQRVRVTGSIKFDMKIPASLTEQAAALRRDWGLQRPVWIAASTHEGEDEDVLDAHRGVREHFPDALLVLVPRHPERFARVAALCREQGWETVLRSTQAPMPAAAEVFVGDSMGELLLFFAASDVAFIGGSLIPHGGHNPLEASAQRVPVLFGPHMFNFEQIAELLLEAGAAREVGDSGQLADSVAHWLADPTARITAGERGAAVVEANKGARDAVLAMVTEALGDEGVEAKN
ncbi:MAG: lipid IV(A) 3-deoxy-D-manno-octulosonic acid transferase [Gammaproteobacteria bacterium]|nr:lipid IV(A) 3-deoxy-D-manno-octulosonic acid transferase [Gammaproteobacteria bacterium]